MTCKLCIKHKKKFFWKINFSLLFGHYFLCSNEHNLIFSVLDYLKNETLVKWFENEIEKEKDRELKLGHWFLLNQQWENE